MKLNCKKLIKDILTKTVSIQSLNSCSASGDFCYQLITFANSFDPEHAQCWVRLDLDPICLKIWRYFGLLFSFLSKKHTQLSSLLFSRKQKYAKLHSMQNYTAIKTHVCLYILLKLWPKELNFCRIVEWNACWFEGLTYLNITFSELKY